MSDDTKSGTSDSSDTSGTEKTGADTLSTLRAQYEAAVAKHASGKDASKDVGEIAALKAEVQRLQAAEADRSYRKEMDSYVVPTVKGDIEVDADLVEAWLNMRGQENPELLEAWNNRGEDRKAFKAAIEAAKIDFATYAQSKGWSEKKGDKSSKTSADDDGKLKSAVRSARSTSAKSRDFSDVDLSKMGDTEFALHSAEVFRLARAGQLT